MAGRESSVVAVVLAGGLARRMGGGDKGLRVLGGRTILARVVGAIAPQVAVVVVNANGDPSRFAALGVPVVPDAIPGALGPLVGVLSAMDWARAHSPGCAWVASLACDGPFVPHDLVARLQAAIATEGADLACAGSGGRDHPVVGLWPVRLAEALRRAIAEEGIRKVDAWTARYRLARAEFPIGAVDPFFNVNTAEELALAERLLELSTGAVEE